VTDTKTPRRPRRGEVRESDARSQTRRYINYAMIRPVDVEQEQHGHTILGIAKLFPSLSPFLWGGMVVGEGAPARRRLVSL
jgi:hypothetical protein